MFCCLRILAVALVLSPWISRAEEWKPAPAPLMTRWGRDVTPGNAWREYPRPQMVRTQWRCLNGLWNYAVVGKSTPWKQSSIVNAKFDPLLRNLPAPPAKWDGRILVPFAIESALSGIGRIVRPEQLLWYRRSFDVPPDWKGQRVLLHFEAVDWHAVVWVNGRKMGEHKGGYTPFSFDITAALKPSGSQQVTLVVWDPSDAGDQAVGKQSLPELRRGFRYTPTTGIWQPVWLEPVPATSIAGLKIIPDVDHQRVIVETAPGGRARGCKVRVSAFDTGERVATAGGRPGQAVALDLPHCRLWSPRSPFLYGLKVKLLRRGKVLDEVSSYFGMRKIEVSRGSGGLPRIKLNGREIFSFGPLDQGYWPDGVLTPPSDAAERADLQYLKDIGCNMVRVHIKVNPARWYFWADKLGLMVWQDFVAMRAHREEVTPSAAAQWQDEMRREMDHLGNHPSIVQWVVFNESWGQHDTERLTHWVMDRDPSRLVDDASGWWDRGVGNVYDIHDYSFYPCVVQPGQLTHRAVELGECGGFNVWLPGHLWGNYRPRQKIDELGEPGRESYLSVADWEKRYPLWLEGLRLLRTLGLNAAVYTQITDVEHECNGWLTYDRAVSKIPVARLRDLHRRLFKLPKPRPLVPMFDAPATAPGTKPQAVERAFSLDKVPAEVGIRLNGTGTFAVSLNGTVVRRINNGLRTSHTPASFVPVWGGLLKKTLHAGENQFSVEPLLRQPGKGREQMIPGPYQAGLFEIVPGR